MDSSFQNPQAPQSLHIPIPHLHYAKIALFLLVFVLGAGCAIGAMALTNKDKGPKKTITILAKGSVEIPADESVVYTYENKTFANESEAKNYITEIKSKIEPAMQNLKISESSYSLTTSVTQGYGTYSFSQSISAELTPAPTSPDYILPKQGTSSYFANISFSANLRNEHFKLTDQVAKVIKDSGISQGPYITYTANESSEYRNKARSEALSDANKQVEELKKLSNIRVGEVLSIKDLTLPTKDKNNAYPIPGWSGEGKIIVETGKKSGTYNASYEVVYLLK